MNGISEVLYTNNTQGKHFLCATSSLITNKHIYTKILLVSLKAKCEKISHKILQKMPEEKC